MIMYSLAVWSQELSITKSRFFNGAGHETETKISRGFEYGTNLVFKWLKGVRLIYGSDYEWYVKIVLTVV